ncbi:O-antigen ligase family protein [Clostridium sp.]|uniref:O-antigen ligase family protein n=1 Tax=Clostridium sp. TaxID=1506 RepID=UPI0037C0F9D8
MENIKNYFKEKPTSFPLKLLIGKPIFFIPISIILTIVPLIVHVMGIVLDDDTTALYGSSLQTDLFSQWKAIFLLCFSILLLIISIIFFKKIFQKKDKIINFILVAVIIFWILTLFSAVFSQHKSYAFWGAFDRAEGFITITCYMLLLIYSIYTFKNTNNYKYIVTPILILVFILSFLGVFQYTGHDLLNSKIGAFIATGDFNDQVALSYQKGKLYGTLYHYDYVGSFVGIVLPLLVTLTVFEKKLGYKIILGIGSLLSLWLLFGSTSRAGLVGVAFSFIFAIILFGKSLLKRWKPISIGLISILILIVGLNFATKGVIFERVPSLLSDALSIFKDTSNLDYSNSAPVKDIKYVDGHSEVVLLNETIKICYENNAYIFKNSKDEIINYSENNRVFTTNDPSFKNISFNYTKTSGRKAGFIYLALDGKNIFGFSLGHDNTIHLINPDTNQDIDVAHPEITKFLIGKEKLGSSRGYIWSRSIPLIKNNLIIGSGPDTFIFQFPQNDYIGKYYAYDTPNMLVDKPHDLYLQIALDYGLIALISFLCIMFIYIFDSIRLYAFKNNYNHSQILGIANALGIIGYLFAGFFNDSIISVAPVFWIVLGVGIAINFINRKAIDN